MLCDEVSVCVVQRAPFGCYASGRTPFRGPETRFALCSVPPSRLRSVGPPRLDAATPEGGLLSSAFLASMVRVHDEVRPGQQKANPNVDSGSVTDPLRGSRRQSRGSGRARSARRGTVASRKPRLKSTREGGALHNASALSRNRQERRTTQTPRAKQPPQRRKITSTRSLRERLSG